MPKVWNLGNTTVRNPNRIESGLRLFADEFQGNVHGKAAEQRFARRLIEEGIVAADANATDWLGRKWRSVLVKLGFATNKDYKIGQQQYAAAALAPRLPELQLRGLAYELSPAGRRLLEADTLAAVQDVFLRQLVRHEIPSPSEWRGFAGRRVKPFICLLQVLQELARRGEQGLTRTEIGAFLQPFLEHTDQAVEQTLEQVLGFRARRDAQQDRVAKRQYEMTVLEAVSEATGIAPASLPDYADTTIRYTRMTGLVTLQGSRLVLRESKTPIIEALLTHEPAFLAQDDPIAYLADFYTGTSLPTDDAVFALDEITRLRDELLARGVRPEVGVTDLSEATQVQELEAARYRLSEQLVWTREEQFAGAQAEDHSVREILAYLEALETRTKSNRMGIVDRPAYLEWAVWRAFLAINQIATPVHQTRRFPIDDDLRPRHPAPGGGADMIFDVGDYLLAVEVTLTGSSRQVAAEGEPVRRHVADVKEKYATKDVYGLFIAPTIDNNTAETFRIGVWYRGDEEDYVNIVPLTLQQFRQIVEALLQRRYSPKELQLLLDRCLTHRHTRAPEWKRLIATEMDRWMEQLSGAS